jgi:putative SOS response-associated peptidase YedK
MCGRFTLRTPLERLLDQFHPDSAPRQLALRFNVAPTQDVAVLRAASASARQLVPLRWGLIPSWARDPSIGSRMINARAETVATKPSFRSAFSRRRCLVLADGYFEWKNVAGKKRPYYIRMEDERPFGMAAIWERWSGPSDATLPSPLETCAIITVDANDQTESVHDRMPAILDADCHAPWLDLEMRDPDALTPLLIPYASERLLVDPVSTRVNNPRNDDPGCIAVEAGLP